jgi:hypothetical protein
MSVFATVTGVQTCALPILPDQVPAPSSQLASQLPSPIAQAAAAIVARLIIQAAQPGSPAGPATPVPAPAGPAQQGVSGGE